MMEAMDTKLAMAMTPTFAPPPRHPSTETLQMMGQSPVLPQNYYNLGMGLQRNVMGTGQPVLFQVAPNALYQ